MGKLTKKLFTGWVSVLCIALLTLPAGAGVQPGVNPMVNLSILFVFVMGVLFVALLLTKRIAAWIDRLREKRKHKD